MKKNISIYNLQSIKKYISLLALALASVYHAQALPTSTENYIYTKVYLSEDGSKKSETVQYFDGLGRPKQMIQVKATPQGQDLVTPIVYDNFGRQSQSVLPVPVATANLGIQNISVASANSYYGVANAYAEQKFEASPIGRVLEAAAPGTDWAMGTGHTQKMQYGVNKTTDKVKKYTITSTWQNTVTVSSLPAVSFYSEKVLTKTSGTDEDGQTTIEFKNERGQTVLVRKVLNSQTNADAYYIYNDYGHLIYVISPKADEQISLNNNTVTQKILDDLCYQYVYDNRHRMVEKKLPGKGKDYMVYNTADKLIMSQDANMRTSSSWAFTKYDKFGRVAYTGISVTSQSRQSLQANVNANANLYEIRKATTFTVSGMPVYYSNVAAPVNVGKILSVNYYDTTPSYSFNPSFPSSILGEPTLTETLTAEGLSTKNLPLVSLVKNIEDDNWTKSYIYYDKKRRAIGSYSINHLGGRTQTESKLDFAGVVQQNITRHRRLNTDTDKVITENFTYDSQNRLLTHTHQVDNNPVEYLSRNTYNELSQLTTKKVGGTVLGGGLQTVDYTYNIRGWVTSMNNPANLGTDLFGYKINYNQVEGLETPDALDSSLKVKPRYNGNIAEVSWKTLTEENEPLKRYGYSYDPLNRLTAGFYQKAGNEAAKEYFEKLEYDINGNITRLKRSEGLAAGSTTAMMIDNLKYDYTGNRLTKVTEEQIGNNNGYPYVATPNTIQYDNGLAAGSGNMTSHLDKGISSIQYNYLNLPQKITQNAKVTDYLYRADGVKLRKLFGDIETNYLDGFQYKSTKPSETSAGGGLVVEDPDEIAEIKLRMMPTSEGYYDFLSNEYIYNYTDHLGNVRLSYSDSNKDGSIQPRRYFYQQCSGPWDPFNPPICIDSYKPGEIVEVNNYYPFGLLHNYTGTTQNVYQYKYNGKELQETGMYDYGARFYMPEIGRWGVVDPLAEVSRSWNPYNYGYNNPIVFTDPDGRLSQSFLNSMLAAPSGTTWYNTGEGFISEGRNAIDYDGNSIDWGTEYTDMLMQRVGLGPSGEGGGIAGTITLPELVLNGYGRANYWGGAISTYNINHGILLNGIAGMQSAWNRAMFDSDRQLGIAEIDRGGVRMMGGDMFGFSDLAGIGIERISEDHPYVGMALGVIGIVALKKPGLAITETKVEVNILRHYTTEAGYKAIMESGELFPSIGIKNARYGSGQYLTDLMSHEFTKGQASRRLFGVPWNGKKMSHFIELDVSGLNVTKNGPHNFLIPGTGNLSLEGIILNHGQSIFKP
ncbi:DUF6443 domain-containing protein [Chryseobacterium cheonjiense]|uniref:RHS repeat-associated core domain-containing protein n=1 Tax=Chryseobacterium cheonjiense TaxID=2728845 RepID=A0A7Y0A9F2_9FLAO|nr:DUF6443 domain-containing protein [Chryseobacterium cheonjiense]NML59089.1 RHS repeat-associated core domain-containing protein [Chryseobacterium cheonjiense]